MGLKWCAMTVWAVRGLIHAHPRAERATRTQNVL
jgi:hypothetical protein